MFPLQTLKEAYVQTEHSHGDGGEDITASRVALLMDEGEILLTYVPYVYGSQEETAKRINAFVALPQQESLQIYEDDRGESQFSGFIWILVSAVVFGVGCIL